MDFVNIYETKKVVSKYETNSENPTVFHVGNLSGSVKAALDDSNTKIEASSSNPNERAMVTVNMQQNRLLALRFGLKNIENAIDPRNGKPLVFEMVAYSLKGKSYNIATEEIVNMIPAKTREELIEIILSENTLSEAERKN